MKLTESIFYNKNIIDLIEYGPDKFYRIPYKIQNNKIFFDKKYLKIIKEGLNMTQKSEKLIKQTYNNKEEYAFNIDNKSAGYFQGSLELHKYVIIGKKPLDDNTIRFYVDANISPRLVIDLSVLAKQYKAVQPNTIKEDLGQMVATALTQGPAALKNKPKTPQSDLASSINNAAKSNVQLANNLKNTFKTMGIQTESVDSDNELKQELIELLTSVSETGIKSIPLKTLVKNMDSMIDLDIVKDREYIEKIIKSIPMVSDIKNNEIVLGKKINSLSDIPDEESSENEKAVGRMAKKQTEKESNK